MKPTTLVLIAAALAASGYASPAAELAAAVRHLVEAPSNTWIVRPDSKVARPTPIECRGNRDGWVVARFVDEKEPWSASDGTRRFVRRPGGRLDPD